MGFDIIVVTAANRAQAEGYRAQLTGRKRFLVIPDPGDRRVGSLGATVNALRKIFASANEGIRPRRMLVCHSGGDARRTPAYAAMGKAFRCRTDVPCSITSSMKWRSCPQNQA